MAIRDRRRQHAGELPASAVRYHVRDRDFTIVPDVLATPRTEAAVAATGSIVTPARDGTGQVLADAAPWTIT
jgi:hypothetical protein